MPDVVREAHNENAPISQPSTSSQKSSVGSKKNDLKSAGGSLDSKLSELNLQDAFDKKFPKASQGGVAAATGTATTQASGNNHQGASGVSNKPPNPNSGSSRDGITRSEETHTQGPNVPQPSNTDGEVVTVPNSEASGDGLTHSEQTHTQVLNMPEPDNTDGGVSTDLNSEASRHGIAHSQQTHSQVLNVPDLANADELINPGSNNEASGDDRNQERNAATAGGNEVSNFNQEATVPVAAVAAAAALPHPDGTDLQSLTNVPIQEEAVHRADNSHSTINETAPSEEAANNYDHLYGK